MLKTTLLIIAGLGGVALLALVALAQLPTTQIGGDVAGWKFWPATWSGTITVTADTRFAPWATLTVAPGTTVRFAKDPDIPDTPWTEFADAYITDHNDPTGRQGYNTSHFDLVGRIHAIGTAAQPIVFTSAQAQPEYADWDQLVLFAGSVLEYTEIAYAHNGVYVGDEAGIFDGTKPAVIANSTVHDSLWSCIDVWSEATVKDNTVYHCWHQGIGVKGDGAVTVEGNTVADAQLGLNCEHGARPTVTNNRFAAAPVNPDCPPGTGTTEIDRPADVPGGTYQGRLIYPSTQVQ